MKNKTISRICYVLCTCFTLVFAVILGGLEAETLPLGAGFILSCISLYGASHFAHLGYNTNSKGDK